MSAITELVRNRVKIIVSRGLDRYGYFPVEEDKTRFYQSALDIVIEISDKIEDGEPVTLTPIKTGLLRSIFILGFDKEIAKELFGLVFVSLHEEINSSTISEPTTVRNYQKYESIILESLDDLDILLSKTVSEYLYGIEQYNVSNLEVNLPGTKSRLLKSNRTSNDDSNFTYIPRLSEKFSEVFSRNVNSRAEVISNASLDINAITSDSSVNSSLPDVDTSLLTATFAGEGNKIYSDIKALFDFSVEMGGYQGSLVGAVDYQARYYEYLMSMCYGKRLPGGVLGGEFGKFGEIYGRNITETSIPGLKFLEPVHKTRSGNQNVGVSYPVVEKFSGGLVDRYVAPVSDRGQIDFVSLALESMYVLCLKVGDGVSSVLNDPPDGIGNTTVHMEMLSRVFPNSSDVRERSIGLTGTVKSLLSSYRSLFALMGYEPDLHSFNERFREVFNLLESLIQTFKSAGFSKGGYVPSLSLTYYEPDRNKIAKNLSRIGFNPAEVERIMSIGSFSELLEQFAPLTDSQDVISFFRAYDLTKLLYEFGGQQAIDQYVNFLYGTNNQTGSLIRLLELLNVNRSLASKVRGSEFSRLIGYVVTLTYAVDPEQLLVLDSVLSRNNLDLFESISQLLTNGFRTVIKPSDEVNLLSGMISQMVVADNSGYEDQKPLWNKLIEESAGNVGTSVSGLYDRAEGITPTELYYYLNNPSATSPLGKILDGVRGGRMTSLLRYCNLFGLLYTLSPYKNSGQLVNESAEKYTTILELIGYMESLTDRIRVTQAILDESARGDRTEEVYDDPIIQAQNKEFGALIEALSGGVDNIQSYGIIESPGIGNSRVPNGVRISNSLTPEEASIVSVVGSRTGSFTTTQSESGSYVRVSVSNLLAAGVSTGVSGSVSITTPDPGEVLDPVKDYSVSYGVESTSGVAESSSQFNPISSCIKFGGLNCSEQGYSDATCNKGFSKALFPEEGYGVGENTGGSIAVDRPLGSKLTRSLSVNVPPDSHPQKYFTASGLSEASRSPLLKDSELMCGSIKDPFEYGACMSLLKCKKFQPPYEGRYWFEFCPSTLYGGRLRR